MELQPYFDAILAAPDDDAPRLALADALDAIGDGRGEAIRVACALEPLERDDPARQQLATRFARLPHFTYFTTDTPWHAGYVLRRASSTRSTGGPRTSWRTATR